MIDESRRGWCCYVLSLQKNQHKRNTPITTITSSISIFLLLFALFQPMIHQVFFDVPAANRTNFLRWFIWIYKYKKNELLLKLALTSIVFVFVEWTLADRKV